MEQIKKLESVKQFNNERGQETLHPLVTVLDNSFSKPVIPFRFISELYIVFLKDVKCAEFLYGRNNYDYEEGTLLFVAPGQLYGLDEVQPVQPSGWGMAFHPDLILGTSLGKHIKNYNFFSYKVNEALHLSARERKLLIESFQKIQYELSQSIDKHSKNLIARNIELILDYCVRFYDRQFITRDNANKDILAKFESLINTYFASDKPKTIGLPSVTYCAGELNLSANYFGDLMKKETGKSAQEYIQAKIIEVAKEKVFDISKSISEVAYEMGFKYPAHFTRMFKQHIGHSPNEYRLLN